ncbi:MAG TPA: PEP-CTERM sorting domain-containing protein [Chthoniobacterales bacterium]|jgi:hypothetical protein
MKKLLTLSLLLLALATARATVTINLGAANLYNANGSQLMQPGMLVQLVASTTNSIFDTPRDGSYTGGSSDDVVLASFSINQGAGATNVALIIDFASFPNLTTGDPLMLRWFPTIAGPANPSMTIPAGPTGGSPFGQFRTDIVEAENGSNFAWTMPADSATITLNFLTQMINPASTHPESDGFANLTVSAIPEPSTYAFLALGLVGAVLARRRLKLAA